jgi:hypothetical protein
MSANFATVRNKAGQVMGKANAGQRKLVYTNSANAWEGWYVLGVGGCCVDAFPTRGGDNWTPINKSKAQISAYLTAKSGDQTSI